MKQQQTPVAVSVVLDFFGSCMHCDSSVPSIFKCMYVCMFPDISALAYMKSSFKVAATLLHQASNF